MRLAVFGGTGNTGRQLIEKALRNGHEVATLAEDPGKLPVHPHFADLASFMLSLVKRTNAQKQAISVAFERRRI